MQGLLMVFGRAASLGTSAYRELQPKFPFTYLSKLLEVVPLAVTTRMWYMQDGVPAYFSRAV
jgi:hypothetical protein